MARPPSSAGVLAVRSTMLFYALGRALPLDQTCPPEERIVHLPRLLLPWVVGIILLSPAARAADHVRFGIFKAVGTSAVFIAQDKGYFAAEGLDVELVPFTAQEPLVLGIASGDLDFGATAFTGGFYNLAGQGALRIIGAFIHEAPGFQANTLIASNKAWDAGLKTAKDLAGRAAGVPEIGNASQYGLTLIAEKHGID